MRYKLEVLRPMGALMHQFSSGEGVGAEQELPRHNNRQRSAGEILEDAGSVFRRHNRNINKGRLRGRR